MQLQVEMYDSVANTPCPKFSRSCHIFLNFTKVLPRFILRSCYHPNFDFFLFGDIGRLLYSRLWDGRACDTAAYYFSAYDTRAVESPLKVPVPHYLQALSHFMICRSRGD